ncbi:helix-turn-helix transcriptional regulator [Actinokineospora soli]|uniref:Helix-turn-helix transcriptional regulator n=1 Tax=Actinokineospora soli TaxID=1048753 RepID=A0ABW2TQY3_9PSEU
MGVEPGRAQACAAFPRRAAGRGDPRVQVRLGYVDGTGAETERTVHPLGIVAKGPWWYLVGTTDAGLRTFRVDRVSSADPTGEPVHRPDDFDLAASWRAIADEVDRRRTPLEVQATCAPDGMARLRMILGDRLEVRGPRPAAASRSSSAATTSTRSRANSPGWSNGSR